MESWTRSKNARLAHDRANLAALEERQRAGELVEVEAVAELVGADYAAVRARMLALPSRAAPLVASITTASEAQAVLDDLMRDALAELSEAEEAAAG